MLICLQSLFLRTTRAHDFFPQDDSTGHLRYKTIVHRSQPNAYVFVLVETKCLNAFDYKHKELKKPRQQKLWYVCQLVLCHGRNKWFNSKNEWRGLKKKTALKATKCAFGNPNLARKQGSGYFCFRWLQSKKAASIFVELLCSKRENC